ncbi:uncharacterized protein EV422DRAFT_522741 [Fimicolochytrium jonesii]|uniref:uncharacterized protein n=1 Tax=Fimicolochytrium jonesii TaxID=1396493 RepID=UPI0022FE9DAC|nr:uncharacterized protein EV422DRAFT_522741 [Fimicolochytrium jonesii]KAI8822934.1 hypothetical protein EV422DRAFT_522741 [Fimicolochytrium jonesii]
MVVGWTLLFIGAFVDEIPASLENIRQELGGAVLFERAAMGIVILHGLETLVAVGFAVYGRFPAVDYLVAIVYVMVFGIKSLGATINVATRRRALLA